MNRFDNPYDIFSIINCYHGDTMPHPFVKIELVVPEKNHYIPHTSYVISVNITDKKPGTVGPKGQVTVPAKFRKELGLQCGDYVRFVKSSCGIIIKKVVIAEVK